MLGTAGVSKVLLRSTLRPQAQCRFREREYRRINGFPPFTISLIYIDLLLNDPLETIFRESGEQEYHEQLTLLVALPYSSAFSAHGSQVFSNLSEASKQWIGMTALAISNMMLLYKEALVEKS